MVNQTEQLRDRISLLPYGPMYAVPAACTVFGLIFYHIAAFGCTTFKASFGTGGFFYESKLGYWSYDSGAGCLSFGSNINVSGAFKFGRFIGIVGALMIWAIFGVMVTASFFKFRYPKTVILYTSIGMGVLSFFSFLLLVGLSSADAAKLGGGGAMAILSAFVWAGGAASMFYCMKERPNVPTSSSSSSSNNITKPSPPTTTGNNTMEATDNADDAA